jgi:spore coat protein U-like protein
VKKLLAIAIASTAIVSVPAFAAESDSNSFDVTATVQPECSIEDPDSVNFGNIAINQDPGASALTINQEFHNSNQSLWVSCNYGAKMTISTQNGGLTNPVLNDGPDAGDFTNVIEYRASLSSAGNKFLTTHMFTNQGTVFSRTNTDAFHEEANLRVYIYQGDNPLRPLAGTYSDVATVAVGPV